MTTASTTARGLRLLEILANADPRFAEILHPPQGPGPIVARFDGARLNPQPLPPHESMWQSVQATYASVAEATIAASLAGSDPGAILREIGDDICPPPRKRPIPKKWPISVELQQALAVDEATVAPAVLATAALVFQSYAGRTADESLSTGFAELADRLTEAALTMDA